MDKGVHPSPTYAILPHRFLSSGKARKGNRKTSRGTHTHHAGLQRVRESRLCHTPSTVDWSSADQYNRDTPDQYCNGRTLTSAQQEAVGGRMFTQIGFQFAGHHPSPFPYAGWTRQSGCWYGTLPCGPGSSRLHSFHIPPLLQLPKTREMTQTQK